jgi:hypothetical protein
MFKIFEKLGGVEPTLDVIQRRRGLRPSARAVLDWQTRRAIPPINTIPLMAECHDRGIPFEMTDYVLADKPPVAKSFPRPRGQGVARLKG